MDLQTTFKAASVPPRRWDSRFEPTHDRHIPRYRRTFRPRFQYPAIKLR